MQGEAVRCTVVAVSWDDRKRDPGLSSAIQAPLGWLGMLVSTVGVRGRERRWPFGLGWPEAPGRGRFTGWQRKGLRPVLERHRRRTGRVTEDVEELREMRGR